MLATPQAWPTVTTKNLDDFGPIPEVEEDGETEVKLAAGDAIMYPASSLHRVATVSHGERLVAVTWVQSLVRDAGKRELLYELNLAREKLLQTLPDAEETAQVNAAYVNLVRMWADI